MRFIIIILLLITGFANAQHTGFSYELTNEIGTYKLVSLTFSHDADNTEGITYVIGKQLGDTIYRFDRYLNGYVALSSDGRTIAHLTTEKEGIPLKKSSLSFYRNDEKQGSADLHQFIKYYLDERVAKDKIPESGWLRNDSLLHKMAANPFYITDDKLYLSFDNPLLMVFDMNRMFHIYTGNGVNHFMQNYYSVPNPPYRIEYDAAEYSPTGFPETSDGRSFEELISYSIKAKIADEKKARTKVLVKFKLLNDGSPIIRNVEVRSILMDELKTKESELIRTILSETSFRTTLIPPCHPAWIFSGIFWLK